jgi:hypothetical protein
MHLGGNAQILTFHGLRFVPGCKADIVRVKPPLARKGSASASNARPPTGERCGDGLGGPQAKSFEVHPRLAQAESWPSK